MNALRWTATGILVLTCAACGTGTTPPTDVVGTDAPVADVTGGDAPVNADVTGGDAPVNADVAPRMYASYTVAAPPSGVAFADVCATGMHATMGNPDDSMSTDATPLELPFAFTLYGGSYTTLHVSTNGWVSFSRFITDSAPRRASGRATLPTEGSPNAAAYVLWEDLHLRDDTSVCFATVGAAPNRAFVVQWNNAYFENNTPADGALTFQVRLNENDSIDMLYQTITAGAGRTDRPMNATVGIENEAHVGSGNIGNLATTTTMVPATGLGIRFTPVR